MATALQHNLSTFAGHAVIAFDDPACAGQARRALVDIGYTANQVRQWTETEMLGQLKAAIHVDRSQAGLPCNSNPPALSDGAGIEAPVKRHHWLIVRVKNEGRAQQVLDHVLRFEPQRARYYRHASFVELMQSSFPSELAWPSNMALTSG